MSTPPFGDGPPPFQPPAAPPPSYGVPGQQPFGYQPAGYQPYGFQPAPSPKTNGLSIASLVLGIIGLILFCLPLPSLLAVIFGFVGRSQISRDQSRGRGMAIAGLVLGAIGIIAAIIFWIWVGNNVHCYDREGGDTKCVTD
jgi:hypothetical protein